MTRRTARPRTASIILALFGLVWIVAFFCDYPKTMRLREEGVSVTAAYKTDDENPEIVERTGSCGRRGSCSFVVTYTYNNKEYTQTLQGRSTKGSNNQVHPGDKVEGVVDPEYPKTIYWADYVYSNIRLTLLLGIGILCMAGGGIFLWRSRWK